MTRRLWQFVTWGLIGSVTAGMMQRSQRRLRQYMWDRVEETAGNWWKQLRRGPRRGLLGRRLKVRVR